MDIKKMNKKGSSMTGIVIAMLIVIGIFTGYYIFFVEQMDNNDATLDSKYNETYQLLLEEQEELDSNVKLVRTSVNDANEASNEFLAAIAGFKGLGAALLLLPKFVDSSFNVATALFFSTDIVPIDFQNLLIVGIVAVITFVLIAILKGESKM